MKDKKPPCPHPTCKGVGKLENTAGGLRWYRCGACNFNFFTNEDFNKLREQDARNESRRNAGQREDSTARDHYSRRHRNMTDTTNAAAPKAEANAPHTKKQKQDAAPQQTNPTQKEQQMKKQATKQDKPAKAAKKEAAPKAAKPVKLNGARGKKIVVLTKENPCQSGSARHRKFAMLMQKSGKVTPKEAKITSRALNSWLKEGAIKLA